MSDGFKPQWSIVILSVQNSEVAASQWPREEEQISEYICIENDTNMIQTNIRIGKYLNIQIFE